MTTIDSMPMATIGPMPMTTICPVSMEKSLINHYANVDDLVIAATKRVAGYRFAQETHCETMEVDKMIDLVVDAMERAKAEVGEPCPLGTSKRFVLVDSTIDAVVKAMEATKRDDRVTMNSESPFFNVDDMLVVVIKTMDKERAKERAKIAEKNREPQGVNGSAAGGAAFHSVDKKTKTVEERVMLASLRLNVNMRDEVAAVKREAAESIEKANSEAAVKVAAVQAEAAEAIEKSNSEAAVKVAAVQAEAAEAIEKAMAQVAAAKKMVGVVMPKTREVAEKKTQAITWETRAIPTAEEEGDDINIPCDEMTHLLPAWLVNGE